LSVALEELIHQSLTTAVILVEPILCTLDLRRRHAWHALSINVRLARLGPAGRLGPEGLSLALSLDCSPVDPVGANNGRPAEDIQ
jgi:hypothetical protein